MPPTVDPNAGNLSAPVVHAKEQQQQQPRVLKLHFLPPPPPFTRHQLAPEEFRTSVKQNFPKNGSRYTPPLQLEEFKFKDYCPVVFRAIRQFFGIHPIDYINSVCGNAEYIEFIS
eukprot:UN10274